MRRDWLMMVRIVIWLAFLLIMTPITAAILRAIARVGYGINLD